MSSNPDSDLISPKQGLVCQAKPCFGPEPDQIVSLIRFRLALVCDRDRHPDVDTVDAIRQRHIHVVEVESIRGHSPEDSESLVASPLHAHAISQARCLP